MTSHSRGVFPPWFTPEGIDLSIYPIDGILRQTLSADGQEFRDGCCLLKSMCHSGRTEAGVFLLGLLKRHPDDYGRLIIIADALSAFPCRETVELFASELRRVRGSSSTRAYLRRLIEALELFPRALTDEAVRQLAADALVGPRFRQRLRSLAERHDYDDDA
jgi:hypothetical protein